MRRTVLSGWEAFARGDLDLNLVRDAPDCHLEPPPEWTAAGMRSSYRGHEGWREWAADWLDAWERMELTSVEIVDAGNPVVVLGQVHQRARESGIELDSPYGSVYWTERGLIVREPFRRLGRDSPRLPGSRRRRLTGVARPPCSRGGLCAQPISLLKQAPRRPRRLSALRPEARFGPVDPARLNTAPVRARQLGIVEGLAHSLFVRADSGGGGDLSWRRPQPG
jgi:ketosteroid isomerase-like protein